MKTKQKLIKKFSPQNSALVGYNPSRRLCRYEEDVSDHMFSVSNSLHWTLFQTLIFRRSYSDTSRKMYADFLKPRTSIIHYSV